MNQVNTKVVNQCLSRRPNLNESQTIIVPRNKIQNPLLRNTGSYTSEYILSHLTRNASKWDPPPVISVNKTLQCTWMSSQLYPIRQPDLCLKGLQETKSCWIHLHAIAFGGIHHFAPLSFLPTEKGRRVIPLLLYQVFITFTAVKVYKVKDETSSGSSGDKCLTSQLLNPCYHQVCCLQCLKWMSRSAVNPMGLHS